MATLMIVLGTVIALAHLVMLVNWRGAAQQSLSTLHRARSSIPAQVKQRWADAENVAAHYRMISGEAGYGLDRPAQHLVRVS